MNELIKLKKVEGNNMLKKGSKIIATNLGGTYHSRGDYTRRSIAIVEVERVNKESITLTNGTTLKYNPVRESGSLYPYRDKDNYKRYEDEKTKEEFTAQRYFVYTEERINAMRTQRKKFEQYNARLDGYNARLEKAEQPYEKVKEEFNKKVEELRKEMLGGKWKELRCSICMNNRNGYCTQWNDSVDEHKDTEICTPFKIETPPTLEHSENPKYNGLRKHFN